eukprot:1107455-Prymnesium_polylepis.1
MAATSDARCYSTCAAFAASGSGICDLESGECAASDTRTQPFSATNTFRSALHGTVRADVSTPTSRAQVSICMHTSSTPRQHVWRARIRSHDHAMNLATLVVRDVERAAIGRHSDARDGTKGFSALVILKPTASNQLGRSRRDVDAADVWADGGAVGGAEGGAAGVRTASSCPTTSSSASGSI